MTIKWLRVILAAVVVEILAIATLVIIVAVWGPSDPEAARLFAERIGVWVGPIAGFILCIIGGWFVARNLENSHIPNGLALGIAVAVIDVALLIAGGSSFKMLFVVSNVGKILAGWLGAMIARRGIDVD